MTMERRGYSTARPAKVEVGSILSRYTVVSGSGPNYLVCNPIMPDGTVATSRIKFVYQPSVGVTYKAGDNIYAQFNREVVLLPNGKRTQLIVLNPSNNSTSGLLPCSVFAASGSSGNSNTTASWVYSATGSMYTNHTGSGLTPVFNVRINPGATHAGTHGTYYLDSSGNFVLWQADEVPYTGPRVCP
jgi:hypothetical protein